MNRVLWPYLSNLIRAKSAKVALALVLMVFLGLTEGIGLVMLIPLLQMVGLEMGEGSLGRIAEFLRSIFVAVGVPPTLISVLCVYVIIISVHGLLFRWQSTASLGLQYEFVVYLRQRLYRAIVNSNWLFFTRSRASDFAHALTTEMERVGAATHFLLRLIATALVTIVYVLFALRLSAPTTLLVFFCGGGLLWLLRGKARVARQAGEGLSETMKGLYAAVTEHLGGMKTAKSYGAEERHANIFAKLTEQVGQKYIWAVRNQAEAKYWYDLGSVFVLSIIVYVAVAVLEIPTAELLVLLFLFARIIPRFSTMQTSYQSFANQLPAFSAIAQLQERCQRAAEPVPPKTEKVELRNAIQLERIAFAYDKAPVIREINLTIRAGETTAIVGPSGVGKTTVADLVMGLIAPDEGRVAVDGIPLGPERMKPWRNQIGYVAQETFLFHDTIRANLTWACPEAREDDIRHALRLAAAEEFVLKLSEGLDAIAGDRGVRLSGGERQRLALARALLRKPSLLILDEATSNLDSENEQRILGAIEGLHGQVTILLITHRLATVRRADIIYVLEDGRLVESGTWDALTAKPEGRFRALCQTQGINGA
ncbi:ABC transporter ATP-binding protein [candidate division BRC1 bacterium SM23_51]|nr:MAG: ABC transporter ATP-binding protein [candidate division BRC1 bacterium SM23_51]